MNCLVIQANRFFFQNILKVAVPTVLTHASWTVTISATPLPVPHRPVPTLSTPRVSAAPCVRMTAPTEPVRSTTGPCVTPYPVPTRRVRIPSPPPGIAVRTVPQVCIMRVYCFKYYSYMHMYNLIQSYRPIAYMHFAFDYNFTRIVCNYNYMLAKEKD